MPSKAATVAEYLSELPADRRETVEAVRKVILKNLPKGYEEGMQYGMIGYYVPHSVYPPGYHCDPKQPLPFAGLASQKNHIGLYLMCVYGQPEHAAWFRKAWTDSGKRLDMGKACVRFRKLDDVPLDVVGEAVRRVPVKAYVEHYETVLRSSSAGKRAASGSKAAAGKKRAPTKAASGDAGRPAAATKKKAAKAGTKKKTTRRAAAPKKAVVKSAPVKKKAAKRTGR